MKNPLVSKVLFPSLKIVLAFDHAGIAKKPLLLRYFAAQSKVKVFVVPTPDHNQTDYPQIVQAAARLFRQQAADFALLVCGTGIGVAMVANRFAFWRAYRFVPGDWEGLTLARKHNNANVITFAGRQNYPRLLLKAVRLFLTTPFSQAQRHQRRIKQFNVCAD